MSTCVVVDTVDWVDATCVSVGDTGFGVLGSSVPSSGANGPAYAYPYLNLATDAGKEVCGRITVWPTNGTLDPAEDTSFVYTPNSDGADSFTWQLYVDGVAIGSPHLETLQSGVAGAASAPGASLTGANTISGGAATGTGAGTAPGVTLTCIPVIIGGSAVGGGGPINAIAQGASMTSIATFVGGRAKFFDRLPAPPTRRVYLQ